MIPVTVWRPTTVEVHAIRLTLRRDGGEWNIPAGCPGLSGDTLTVVIDLVPSSHGDRALARGSVRGWPEGFGACELFIATRAGAYDVLGAGDRVIGRHSGEGIPEWVPSCARDTIWLDVGGDGLLGEFINVGLLQGPDYAPAVEWLASESP